MNICFRETNRIRTLLAAFGNMVFQFGQNSYYFTKHDLGGSIMRTRNTHTTHKNHKLTQTHPSNQKTVGWIPNFPKCVVSGVLGYHNDAKRAPDGTKTGPSGAMWNPNGTKPTQIWHQKVAQCHIGRCQIWPKVQCWFCFQGPTLDLVQCDIGPLSGAKYVSSWCHLGSTWRHLGAIWHTFVRVVAPKEPREDAHKTV